jgi:hypothetical protein
MTTGTSGRRPSRPDRAVSITVNYVIVLGITAVLISGLLVGAGGYVQDQRESVVREELSVVAEQVAAGIDDADRLARADGGYVVDGSRTVRVGVDLPDRVADESYRIEVTELSTPPDQPERHELTLRSSTTRVSVTLTISTRVDLREGSVGPGRMIVRLNAGGPTLVLDDGDGSGALSLDTPPVDGGGGAEVTQL